jgi:hypothetical protein
MESYKGARLSEPPLFFSSAKFSSPYFLMVGGPHIFKYIIHTDSTSVNVLILNSCGPPLHFLLSRGAPTKVGAPRDMERRGGGGAEKKRERTLTKQSKVFKKLFTLRLKHLAGSLVKFTIMFLRDAICRRICNRIAPY